MKDTLARALDAATSAGAAFAGARAGVAGRVWAEMPASSPELMAEYLALSETLIAMEHRGFACDADDLRQAGHDFTAMREAGHG